MSNRIGLTQVTSDFVEKCPDALAPMLRKLGPEGGDFVVIRAERDRASAIRQNLASQLIPEGVVVHEVKA